MSRAANRKLRSKLTEEQFARLIGDSNRQYVESEVNRQIKFYQHLWTDCLTEAFKKHGLSLIKQREILEDVELIMRRKVQKKKEGKDNAKA